MPEDFRYEYDIGHGWRFSCKIDPNSTEEDETIGAYMPWNFPAKKFGGFNLPLILENENKKLKKTNRIYKEILVQEIEYVEQRHVHLDDFKGHRQTYRKWLEESKKK